MPEAPDALWKRAKDSLRTPPVDEWETWPFVGAVEPRPLEPPVAEEQPRHGDGGAGCNRCADPEGDGLLWSDEHWLVRHYGEPTGLPMVVLLETRAHVDFHELDEGHAAELGPLLIRIQRAVASIPHVGNVHVCRWGDGSEHFHVWFMARPERLPQVRGSFAAIWDDILPPLPEDVWRENVEIVRRALNVT